LEESVTVLDNTTDLVTVKSLASGDSTPEEGDTVTFQITVTNNGGSDATGVFLTDFLPAGLTATANNGTTSQGTYFSSDGVFGIGDLAVGETATLILEGTVDAGQGGNTITNTTTAATGEQVDPSTAGDDLDESVVVDPQLVPDIGVAKLAADAVANGDNYDVIFVLLVENTGTAALDGITLHDDVAAQFGNAYVSVSNLAVSNFVGTGTAPVANAAWTGDTTQSLLSGGLLNVGDFVEVTFVATIDPDGIDGSSQGLINEAFAAGNGLAADQSPLLDAQGNLLTATDVSDNGASAATDNGAGTDDDPTPVVIADLGIAKSIAGTPVLTSTGNSIVSFEVVIANTGTVDLSTLSLQEDIASQFGPAFISASNLTLITAPAGTGSAVYLEATFNGATVTELLDQTQNNYLAVGDSFTIGFDIEVDPDQATGTLTNQVSGTGFAIDANGDFLHDANGDRILASDLSDSGVNTANTNPGDISDNGTSDDPTIVTFADDIQGTVDGTSGSPANLRGVPVIGFSPISQLFRGFLGGPGPIYSGIPIASNVNPLTLQSSRPVTGGYATQFAVPTDAGLDAGLDACGCGDAVQSFQEYAQDPYVEIPHMEDPYAQQVIDGQPLEQEFLQQEVTGECQSCQQTEVVPCQQCQQECSGCCGCNDGAQQGRTGVLFRIKNWLHH
jgi:uncharacterized repeat protein (TIGR01451 family)